LRLGDSLTAASAFPANRRGRRLVEEKMRTAGYEFGNRERRFPAGDTTTGGLHRLRPFFAPTIKIDIFVSSSE